MDRESAQRVRRLDRRDGELPSVAELPRAPQEPTHPNPNPNVHPSPSPSPSPNPNPNPNQLSYSGCQYCESSGTVVCINCQGSGLNVPDDFVQASPT